MSISEQPSGGLPNTSPSPPARNIPTIESTILHEEAQAVLYADSGQTDETGKPLTNLEYIRLQEAAKHGGEVILRMDGRLSPENQRKNRITHALVKAGVAGTAGALVFAVVARRLKHKQDGTS